VEIRVEHLKKSYHDADRELTVVDDLSVTFPAGRSIAIVGRSGVGKSTLLHLLGGLDRPTSGQVIIEGVSISSLADEPRSAFRGKNVGFVFQSHHLLPEFCALENVAMPLIIAGEKERNAMQLAAEMLGRVGLSERLKHRPGELSGGEQQRVAIARAIVTKPRIVLADEPTGNLDFETAKSVQALLLEVLKEIGCTLIIVTHSLELAQSLDIVLEMLPGGGLVQK
jgi:lipoprotein-releasing system ATP-binding protein